jgi:hypothetical protein
MTYTTSGCVGSVNCTQDLCTHMVLTSGKKGPGLSCGIKGEKETGQDEPLFGRLPHPGSDVDV